MQGSTPAVLPSAAAPPAAAPAPLGFQHLLLMPHLLVPHLCFFKFILRCLRSQRNTVKLTAAPASAPGTSSCPRAARPGTSAPRSLQNAEDDTQTGPAPAAPGPPPSSCGGSSVPPPPAPRGLRARRPPVCLLLVTSPAPRIPLPSYRHCCLWVVQTARWSSEAYGSEGCLPQGWQDSRAPVGAALRTVLLSEGRAGPPALCLLV